ncbi:MAG: protease inhibitor I42 family protein [Bacteroidales bacterium]
MIRYFTLVLVLISLNSAIGQDSLYYITPEQTKIDIKANEPFIVKLRACHSCGIRWFVEQLDTLNIKLISVTRKNTSGRVYQKGGSVFEFWKFIGLKVGTYNLEFVQKGPAREFKEYGRCKFELWVN